MEKKRIRGFYEEDIFLFDLPSIEKIKKAQTELQFLLDRGYSMKSAVTFVCNHHNLSTRQSLALKRSTSPSKKLEIRKSKQLESNDLNENEIYIDGFNLIISLEVALSDGMLFIGQDGCIRDLAELRGTYRLIPQTELAILLIRNVLEHLHVSKVIILLDEPVSNSGRLKVKIFDIDWHIPVEVNIVRSPDTLLKKMSNVVTADAIILDECFSWFNLLSYMLIHCSELKHRNHLIDFNSSCYSK